jgi:hypothetical protein
MAHRALCFENRASIIGGPGQIGNENKKGYGKSHYQHYELRGFHDFVFSL